MTLASSVYVKGREYNRECWSNYLQLDIVGNTPLERAIEQELKRWEANRRDK
jgi:hypothetical protein